MDADYRRGHKKRLHLFARRKKRKGTQFLEYRAQKRQRLLETTGSNFERSDVPDNSCEVVDSADSMQSEIVSQPTYDVLQPVPPTLNDIHDAAIENPSSLNFEGSQMENGENQCDPVSKPLVCDAPVCSSISEGADVLRTDNDDKLISEPSLSPSTSIKNIHLEGIRMVEISNFLEEITKLSNHNPSFGCSLSNMRVIKEIPNGLSPTFVLHCNMCNCEFPLHCDVPDKSQTRLDVNTRAVAGIMSIGGGFSHLEEFCSSLGIPCMSSKTYCKMHDRVCDGWESAAVKKMEEAVKEEAALAIERGDVSEDGTPLLTVVADGCWSKRSYRCQYNALSGVAAIVGYYTKKILFMAVRNKFCFVCARYSKEDIPVHHCYKNWSGSSASMEASIIVQGFKQSESLYGVKFSKLIADGDSSCYAKILEERPYADITVEKIECRNHLLRNYCTKLRNLSEQKKVGPLQLRKLIGAKILKLRTAVTQAVKHRKNEHSDTDKIALLRKDIINAPCHVFGDHANCEQYFCQGRKENETNMIPDLKVSGLYNEMMKAVLYLANHSRSLLCDVDSNVVEQFNSIVAKFVGGKRVNYSLKRSYQGRCAAAVVAHNTNKHISMLHKTMCSNVSPNKFVKRLEARRSLKRKQAASKRSCKKALQISRVKCSTSQNNDADYGPRCQKPDMTPEQYQEAKNAFLQSYPQSNEERNRVERATVLQAESGQWLEVRRKMLTASNFGKICRRRSTTSCKSIIKRLMYSKDILNTPSISHGRKYESTALAQFEAQEKMQVVKCGLFIDQSLPYLGASPDGLLGEEGLVEIKCPLSSAGMDPDLAVSEGKIKFLTCKDNNTNVMEINKKHEYYYQIQGQLHVTKRKFCLLCVWTSERHKVKIVKIYKDDAFWENCMEPYLTKFYINCMLPELVDPRHTRNMEIRDPDYIIEAQKKQAFERRKKNA